MTITTFQHRRVKGQPRPKHTYRAARRNDMRGLVWKGAATKRSLVSVSRVSGPKRQARLLMSGLHKGIA